MGMGGISMKKVYLVYMDNGEMYDDYYEDVEYIFSTNEKASMWLISKGFNPHCDWLMGEPRLRFIKDSVSFHGDDVEYGAWIVEKKIEE